MPTLTTQQPHHLSKLLDELLAALPALAPVPGPGGERRAVLRLEGPAGPRRVKLDPPQREVLGTDSAGRPILGEWLYQTLPAESPDTLHLAWPDASGVTVSQVQAIVEAHDPTPPPRPDPLGGVDSDALDALVAAATGAASLAEAKVVLRDTALALRAVVRRLRRQAGVGL